jgi:hypothetical protein
MVTGSCKFSLPLKHSAGALICTINKEEPGIAFVWLLASYAVRIEYDLYYIIRNWPLMAHDSPHLSARPENVCEERPLV